MILIDLILDLCETFLSNKNFPDKAFDIIDQIGAKTKIKYKNTCDKMDTLRTKFSKMMVQADNEDFDEEEFTNTLKDYIQSLSNDNGGKENRLI